MCYLLLKQLKKKNKGKVSFKTKKIASIYFQVFTKK